MHINTHLFMYTYVYVYIHIYIYINIFIYIYTHAHTSRQLQRYKQLSGSASHYIRLFEFVIPHWVRDTGYSNSGRLIRDRHL